MNNKKFDTILVTNMSRFSRNYLDAGNYLDHIFPKNNIRFTATGDYYDSAIYDDEESFAIKLWLNDMYLKDIGNKIRFANQKRSETKYMSTGVIYGLRKNESGQFESSHNKTSKRGSKYLRWAIHQALSSIWQHDNIFKDYYFKKIKEGKHHYVAIHFTL